MLYRTGPLENDWFLGNPIKCGFTDHAKTIPVIVGSNIGEFDFGPVVPGKHDMNREELITFLTRKYADATPELISLFEKAYPDKSIADLWSVDTFFRPATIEFIRQKSEFSEAPTYSYQFTYEFPIDGEKPHGTVLRFHSYSTTSTEWLSATSQVKPTVSRNA